MRVCFAWAVVAVGLMALSACQGEGPAGPAGLGGTGATGAGGSGPGGAGPGGTGSGATAGGGSGPGGAASGGSGGAGGSAAIESCADISATECFSNYDCSNAATRCQNMGTSDWPVACCVNGARGQGALGHPCTNENDCASSLCLETTPQWLCSDRCPDLPAQCIAALPNCVAIPVTGGSFSFCSP